MIIPNADSGGKLAHATTLGDDTPATMLIKVPVRSVGEGLANPTLSQRLDALARPQSCCLLPGTHDAFTVVAHRLRSNFVSPAGARFRMSTPRTSG